MKSTELIATVAAELGMKHTEVNTRVRYIREAGFISSGGRGSGAPHMNAKDLAAFCLGMISFVEGTNAGNGLSELQRSRLESCKWLDLKCTEASFSNDADKRPRKNLWSDAPLPPIFGDILVTNDPIYCLSSVLDAAGSGLRLDLRCLGSRSDRHGLSVFIQFSIFATPNEMKERYVLWSQDPSDGMYFSDEDQERQWNIDAHFLLREDQMDKRNQTTSIDGDILSRLVRKCSDKWEYATTD